MPPEIRDANLTLSGKPRPALNATSDAPGAELEPNPAVEAAPEPTPAPPPESPAVQPEPPPPPPPPAPPTPPSGRGEIQARFSEMATQRREAVARAEEAEQRVKQLSETLERVIPIVERLGGETKPAPA